MSHRILVPDTSVMVAAFFEERHTRAAQRLVGAIRRGQARAFAPHAMMVEFLKTATSMRSGRDGRRREATDLVEEQVQRFLELPIVFVREVDLAHEAWRLMTFERISPPDAWMLACAMHVGGELWVSHDHADGFVAASRVLYSAVRTLADDPGHVP